MNKPLKTSTGAEVSAEHVLTPAPGVSPESLLNDINYDPEKWDCRIVKGRVVLTSKNWIDNG